MRKQVLRRWMTCFLILSLCSGVTRTEASSAPVEYVEEVSEEGSYGQMHTAEVSDEWSDVIDQTVNWWRGSESNVLNSTFLQGVSSTATDWVAFSMGRLGVSDKYKSFLTAADDYVSGKYEKNTYGLSKNVATEWHRLTMAVLAAGGDPTDVGGQNLIKDGVYDCKVGVPWKQGINGAIWALLALDTEGYEVPKDASYDRSDLIDYILGEELTDGGWKLSGSRFDVDITAMAIQALAPYYAGSEEIAAAVDRGMALLYTCIQPEGDVNGYGSPNCESTAQVIVACASLGMDPDSVNDSEGGASLMDGLMRYYNTSTGGFLHTLGGTESNNIATGQAMYAIAAYRMYKQGHSLYDFCEDSVEDKYIIEGDDGNTYTLASEEEEILVAPGVSSIRILNVPMGNYDYAVVRGNGQEYSTDYRRSDGTHPVAKKIELGSSDEDPDGITLTMEIYRQTGGMDERTLTIRWDESAAIQAVMEAIAALPDYDSLKLSDAARVRAVKKQYDRLCEADQMQVENRAKLEAAMERIQKLEAAQAKELNQKRKALEKKIKAIKTPVSISQEAKIRKYMSQLNRLGNWSKKASLKKTLKSYLKYIKKRKNVAEKLNSDIWDRIDPLRITQSSEKMIQSLMKRYQALDKAEKKLVTNKDSLITANGICKKLDKYVIPAAVFSNMASTQENFTFKGKTSGGDSYTLTYTASRIQSYVDVQARVSTGKADSNITGGVLKVVLKQSGSMNGSPSLTLNTKLADGSYDLRWYSEEKGTLQSAGTATVSEGKLYMNPSMGGTYTLVKRSSVDPTNPSGSTSYTTTQYQTTPYQTTHSTTQYQTTQSTTQYQTTQSTTHSTTQAAGSSTTSASTQASSNLIKSQRTGMFLENELMSIKNQDKILQTSIGFGGDSILIASINGKDVTNTDEFVIKIGDECKYKTEIEALSDEVLPLCLEDTAEFPGTLLITLSEEAWEDKLMLFSYDGENKSAEYLKMVTIDNGIIKFTLDEPGDYFIAARAKASAGEVEETTMFEIPEGYDDLGETEEIAEESSGEDFLEEEEFEEEAAQDASEKKEPRRIRRRVALPVQFLLVLGMLGADWYLKKKDKR